MNVRRKKKSPALVFSASSKYRDKSRAAVAPIILTAGMMFVGPAAHADSGGAALEEVVVTATRREVGSLQVPISLTAIGADQLQNSGVNSATQLTQLAPNLSVVQTVSEASPHFSMRGVSSNDTLPAGASSVATYVDDVYQASQFGITNALFDLQRVEVLRGPQGTTFGRNTTGGAIEFFSQTPTNEFEGYTKVRAGRSTRPEQALEAAVNVPLVDGQWATRVSVLALHKDPYLPDTTRGEKRGSSNSMSGRVQLRWTPGDSTSANLTAFISKLNADGPLGRFQFGTDPFDRDSVSLSPRDFYDDSQNTGATLRLEHDFGWASLTAITHYRRTTVDQAQDLDGEASDFFAYKSQAVAKQYGQEVRLASDLAHRVSGIAGLYYEKDKIDDHTTESSIAPTSFLLANTFSNPAHYVYDTKAYAAFANVTVKLAETLSITGGVRKTVEDKSVDALKVYFQTAAFPWTDDNVSSVPAGITPDQVLAYRLPLKVKPWTWDGTVNFTPTADATLFLRVAKGFRSGGFNPAATAFPFAPGFGPPFFPQSVPPAFEPEEVQSYEIGAKTAWLDRRLRVSASIFHYDYTNQQVTVYPNAVPTTNNAGQSKVDGGELEIAAKPIPSLELTGSVGYTDARYEKFPDPTAFPPADYAGNQLIQSPKWTVNAGLTYTQPVWAGYQFVGNTNWSYRSAVFADPANSALFETGAVTMGNVRLSFEPDTQRGLWFGLYANNVTDRRFLDSGFSIGPGVSLKYFNFTRVIGLEAGYRF